MPSHLNLVLDTHAPVVTWGPVSGTDAGEDFAQLYTLDEPGIYQAELHLLDGRVLPLAVDPDALRVTLPDDTPEGQAEVWAYVRDDVLNTATRKHTVALTGVAGPPAPVHPVLPVPARERPAPRRVEWAEAPAHVSSSDRVRALSPSISRLRTRTRYTVPTTRTLSRRSRLYASSTTHVLARAEAHGGGSASSSDRLWKRPEGPRFEEELIELDLL